MIKLLPWLAYPSRPPIIFLRTFKRRARVSHGESMKSKKPGRKKVRRPARCRRARCARNWAICISRSGATANRDSRAITKGKRTEIIGLPPDFYRNAAIYTIETISRHPLSRNSLLASLPIHLRERERAASSGACERASCVPRTLHSRAKNCSVIVRNFGRAASIRDTLSNCNKRPNL